MTIQANISEMFIEQLQGEIISRAWQGREGGAGQALVHLFGRLSELVINRLNQVPDKHFLAFLNEAGVDLLAPRPASTELTFTPAEDGPPVIRVPAGTELAIANSFTSEACMRVALGAQQLHGGAGVDLDHDLHFYFRRAKALELKFGSAPLHLEALEHEIGL